MADTAAFGWLCNELERVTTLNRLEARGTVRIALKQAGLESRSVTPDQMRVVEKFTRTGNEMLYEVTVEDPVVLAEPWVLHPRTLQISNRLTIIRERGSCTDTELGEVSTQIRH